MVRAVALGAVTLLVGAAGAAAQAPTLRISDRTPLTVVGEGFAPGERVTVTALTGLGPRIVRVAATRGRFRVEFEVPAKGCGAAFAVRARRANGSVVIATLASAGVCIPPPRD
jgi:hypothetical protein